jgi:DNA polymerase-1
VDTLERLREIRDDYFTQGCPFIANDTETTSLSVIDAELVGFSFCYESNKTYYVPVGHKIGKNAPLREALDILFEMLYGSKEYVLYWNYRYDDLAFT